MSNETIAWKICYTEKTGSTAPPCPNTTASVTIAPLIQWHPALRCVPPMWARSRW